MRAIIHCVNVFSRLDWLLGWIGVGGLKEGEIGQCGDILFVQGGPNAPTLFKGDQMHDSLAIMP